MFLVAVAAIAACTIPPRIAHAAPTISVGIDVQGSGTNDNAVRRGKSIPCQIKFLSTRVRITGNTVHVVLTSPNDAISFDGSPPGRNQLEFDLPTNGNPLPFRVTGRRVGTRLNNARIHAHRSNAYTTIAGSATLTVYDIVTYRVSVERGDAYRADTFQDNGDDFFRYGGHNGFKAAHLKARAEIKPSGVPGNIAGVQNLRVALVQNVVRNSRYSTVSSPTATGWGSSVPRGTTYPVDATLTVSERYPPTSNTSPQSPLTDAVEQNGLYGQYGLYTYEETSFTAVQPINSPVHTFDTPGANI